MMGSCTLSKTAFWIPLVMCIPTVKTTQPLRMNAVVFFCFWRLRVLALLGCLPDHPLGEELKKSCMQFLILITKSCIQNEETIRLCAQIFRVIAFGESAYLLITSDFFILLDFIFNTYSNATSILLHCFCCLLHLLRNKGMTS